MMNSINAYKHKLSKPTILPKTIFWITVGFFVILIFSVTLIPFLFTQYALQILLAVAGVFGLLGLTLLILVTREDIERKFKVFLILTGASAIGIPVSIALHNLVYSLFIRFLGENFWERTTGGDEPVFFTLATIILPVVFIVGVIGSIILFLRRRKTQTI